MTEDDKARKIQLVLMVLLHKNYDQWFQTSYVPGMKLTICLNNIHLLSGNGNYAS